MRITQCVLNFTSPIPIDWSQSIRQRKRPALTCSLHPKDDFRHEQSDDPSWTLLTERVSQLREKEIVRDRLLAHNWRTGGYSQSIIATLADDYVRRLSLHGDCLVCGTATGTTVFVHIPSGKYLQCSNIHVGQVTAVHYTDSFFASAGATDHTVAIWSSEKLETPRFWTSVTKHQGVLPQPTLCIESHNEIITQVIIDAQDQRIYTASLDGFVHVHNLHTGALDLTVHVGEPIFSMVLTEKKYLLVGCESGRVQAYQAKRGLFLLSIQCHNVHTTAIDFYEENQTLVTGNSYGHIRVWSFRDSTCVGEIPGHESAVVSIQVDRTKVISAGRDGRINVASLTNLQRLYTIGGFTQFITTAFFDETRLISDGTNEVILCHHFDNDDNGSKH